MTVAITPPRVDYIENGATTLRAVPFQFLDAADLVVTRTIGLIDTVLPTNAYVVTGGNGLTGSITLNVAGPNLAKLRIERRTAIKQLVDYLQGDSFPAETHERAIDRLTMIAQELSLYLYTVEQLQDILSTLLTAGTNIGIVYDDAANTLTINNLFGAEEARDTIAAALAGTAGITVTVDDAGNTITLAITSIPAAVAYASIAGVLEAGPGIELTENPDTGKVTINCTVQNIDNLADMLLLEGDQQDGGSGATGQISPEIIRDVVAAALVAGGGVTITNDDAGNTITIETTAGLTLEQMQDAVAAMLQPGVGMDVFTYDDTAGTLTIATSGGGGGGGLTTEDVRDAIAAALVSGGGCTITNDDVANTITITADVDASYKGLTVIAKAAAFTFAAIQNGRSIDYTGSSANATIDPQATTALPDGFITTIRNNGAPGTVLTLHRGAAVVLKANGGAVDGDVQIDAGNVATLQRWAADDFTVMVAAG
jgi:hypothetical protein